MIEHFIQFVFKTYIKKVSLPGSELYNVGNLHSWTFVKVNITIALTFIFWTV